MKKNKIIGVLVILMVAGTATEVLHHRIDSIAGKIKFKYRAVFRGFSSISYLEQLKHFVNFKGNTCIELFTFSKVAGNFTKRGFFRTTFL